MSACSHAHSGVSRRRFWFIVVMHRLLQSLQRLRIVDALLLLEELKELPERDAGLVGVHAVEHLTPIPRYQRRKWVLTMPRVTSSNRSTSV